MNTRWEHSPLRVVVGLLVMLTVCIGFAQSPRPARPNKNSVPQKSTGLSPTQRKADLSLKPKSYTRPKPSKPITPYMPNVDRRQPDKFFLEKADLLYSNEDWDTTRQVVSGNVMFSKLGTLLYCDSAWYYPQTASLDAFGNVRMLQGDTIEVRSDFIYYDGLSQLARLRTGGTGRQVTLEHTSRSDGTKKYLYTDSLDYNLLSRLAYYDEGGTMYNVNTRTGERDTLTSRSGQYDTNTRVAEVNTDVYIRNRTSNLRTNRLLYHTDTRVAEIVEPTEIYSGSEYIRTASGNYDMGTGDAELTTRSLVVHTDSLGRATTLEGDSMVYNKAQRRTEAYMFTDPMRNARPMVIVDTARHATLIGGYGYYSDSTHTAYAERYPLLKEYSRPDTTYLRANTIFLETFNYGVKPLEPLRLDSLSTPADSIESARIDSINANTEYHIAKAFERARFFRDDLQGIADSITFVSRDSMLYMDRKPIVWSGPRLVAGSRIEVHLNDSTADWAYLPAKGLVVEEVGEGFYNQLRAGKMMAFLEEETLKHLDADTDVQTILLPMENDSTYNKLVYSVGDTLSVDMDKNDLQKLKLYSRSGSEVTGQVTPLFRLQKSQYYLPEFVSLAGVSRFSEMDHALEVLSKLRPEVAWYRKGWEDSLGELSFELDEYFTSPDMGISSDNVFHEVNP